MEKGEMSEAGSSRHLPRDGPEAGACEGTNTKGSAPPVRLLIADDAKRLAANTRHKVIISTVARKALSFPRRRARATPTPNPSRSLFAGTTAPALVNWIRRAGALSLDTALPVPGGLRRLGGFSLGHGSPTGAPRRPRPRGRPLVGDRRE